MAVSSALASVPLRPDRKLLDPKFDSYKLSLNPLPSYKAAVSDGVYCVAAGEEDFGYEKIRCLTMHNHLVLDPWNKENVYYVDANGCIRRFHIPLETHIEPAKMVFSFGSEMSMTKKKLPPTVYFPSPTLCVACDGLGSIFVLNTGLRNEWSMNVWQILYFDEVSKSPCMVLHAVARNGEVESVKMDYLDALFLKFEDKGASTKDKVIEVVMEWESLEKEINDDEYKVNSMKIFRGKSLPNFVALSSDCSELHIASNSPFKFVPTWNTEADDEIKDLDDVEEEESDAAAPPTPYKWKQSSEDVTILVDLPPDATSSNIVYSLNFKEINIAMRENPDKDPKVILAGHLFLEADPEASSWIISDERLEVTIQKKLEGRTWLTVVEGDDRGEFIVDPQEAARVQEQLAHLTSENLNADEPGGNLFNPGEFEECDTFYESTASLVRFDATTDKFTHIADVSSLRWLYNCILAPDEPPAVVFRHDVDAVVWQPTPVAENKEKRVFWKHAATFNALGYVHASKTNLKFCSSPPDTSFAAFCECQRRLYVYRQPTPLSTSLRNRQSGQVVGKVAIQQVATLEGNDDILGFAVSNERIYALTADELIVFKVGVDQGA